MVEVVQMSLKEADWYAVIQQVIERTIGQSDAALWLNLSVRQVERLTRTIRQDGAQGAVSRRRGVPSNRRISHDVRSQHSQWLALEFTLGSGFFSRHKSCAATNTCPRPKPPGNANTSTN